MLSRCIPGIVCLASLAPIGCEAPLWSTPLPQPRPLGAEHAAIRPATVIDGPRRAAAPEEPAGELTLRAALALALTRSPELAGFAWSVRQAEAECLQAQLLPNPELEAEFENFAGSGEFRGTRALETTIALSQLIELGGKRAKRLRLARHDSRLAGWDYEAKRLEVLTATAGRFIEVLAIQEKLDIAREELKLVAATHDAVRQRVVAGKAAPAEQSKATVEVAGARIRIRRAELALLAARHALGATWGSDKPRFSRAAGDLTEAAELPPIESLVGKLAQSPAIARWETEISRRRAALALAEARGIGDLTVGAGYRHFRETASNDRAMLLTVGVPLPLFDRNQGDIRKAKLAVLRAKADRQAARVKVRNELEGAYQALAAAHAEATSLKSEVLPAAQQSHEAVRQSYQQGKVGYLDLLDAQRTLIKARREYVEALALRHQAAAEVEGLIAEPLSTHPTAGSQDRGSKP